MFWKNISEYIVRNKEPDPKMFSRFRFEYCEIVRENVSEEDFREVVRNKFKKL